MLVNLRTAGHWFGRVLYAPAFQLTACLLLPALVSISFYQLKKRNFTRMEVLEPYAPAAEAPKWRLETVRLKHGRYEIEGWVTQEPQHTFWLRPRIVLVPPNGANSLVIRARMVLRPDVSAAMGTFEGLHFSGFRAVFRKKNLPIEPGSKIMISIEKNGKRVLIDTGHTLPDAP